MHKLNTAEELPILSGLNPEQRAAVTLPRQSALILAGAGSGKTRVLTTRIAYLLQTRQASPFGILAVTFTNKAAREMLTRLEGMLGSSTRGMWVGTFHGLCNRLLRAHYRDVHLPQTFQILDSADQLGLIKRLMKSMQIDEEKFPARKVQGFICASKEEGLRAENIPASDPYTERLREIYAAYDAQINREGVVDFAELLLRSFELLSRNAALREHYQARFAHILVDEFQDTNRLQYRWLKLFSCKENAMFAVGDDDQSIYAFRGAHTGNMREFERDFHIGEVIKLEQNYRSHGTILDAANALISCNRERLGKNLWTAEGAGEPIRVYQALNDQDEASFIVGEVQALAREGTPLNEIALLYRSNAQSRVLEHALFNAGIAYRVYGGLRFFERQEIKHALAYLRLIANPDDDGAFLRIINFPTRGIGARSLEQLQDVARVNGISLSQAAKSGVVTGRSGTAIATFSALIDSLRAACANLPLNEQVEHVLAHSGLRAFYEVEKDAADRLENLNELVNAAIGFEREEEASTLEAFLAHASLEAGEHQAGAGTEALQLMTIHSAKGLEFHSVFISGLEEGLFPHENSFNEFEGLEEERRLMYVAITRARRRLYLTYAQSRMLHGQMRYGIASRFLEELPPQLLKLVNAKPQFHAAPSAARRSTPPFAQPDIPWRIGQNVVHAKFGSGVIVNAEGRGFDARVQVNFRDAGVKWLALEYAKLAPA